MCQRGTEAVTCSPHSIIWVETLKTLNFSKNSRGCHQISHLKSCVNCAIAFWPHRIICLLNKTINKSILFRVSTSKRYIDWLFWWQIANIAIYIICVIVNYISQDKSLCWTRKYVTFIIFVSAVGNLSEIYWNKCSIYVPFLLIESENAW